MIATSRSLADPLFRNMAEAFPPEQDYPLQAFDQEPMPPLVVHYLSQYLAYRLDRETRRLLKVSSTPWFAHDHPDVKEAQHRLKTALTQHIQIPAARWRNVLHRAIQEVTAHLAQPQRTLATFVFEQDRFLPMSVIDRRMGYFAAYPYFREEVELYVARRNVKKMDQEQFEELLRRIDQEVTQDFEPEDWVDLLRPLFDLQPYIDNRRGLHVKWLESFFIEKGERDIVHYLRRRRDVENTRWLDEEAVFELLRAPEPSVREAKTPASGIRSAPLPDGPARPEHPAVAAEPSVREEEDAVPAPAVTLTKPPVIEPAPPAPPKAPTPPTSEPVPLWKQFQKGLQQENVAGRVVQPPSLHLPDTPPHGIDTVPAKKPAPAPKPVPVKEEAGVPLWKKFHSERAPEEEISDLAVLERSVLGPSGPRNRGLFIEELFDGSTHAYRQTLERLLGAPGWPEASHIIAEDVFRAYQVNIYSDPAVMFTDAVELRYRQ